jgi:SAM-dependent methyltransferase
MKLRQSGMPVEQYWESLFDVELILDRLEIDGTLGDVVELGCGYGTFTLPVARRIRGHVAAFDVDRAMVERTRQRATEGCVANVSAEVRDVAEHGFPVSGQDGCMLFNILHCEDPGRLLEAAATALRPGGVIHVIHWRRDEATPRGPTMDIRPRPEEIVDWAQKQRVRLTATEVVDLPPWHYGLNIIRE